MGKNLYIAEKPSVAREFARALGLRASNREGYMEAEEAIVTWCVGHLVTMSYPEAYDEKYKRWSLATIPFIPEEFKYEVIENVKKQFAIVSGLLNRKDVEIIYVCTDSGREGEYIYRLVERQAGVKGKCRRRVWIDSQTEEEILRGIREAKDLTEYDNLGAAAYLRAKEDYLMGINFSRVLTLKYGSSVKSFLNADKGVVSVGRVMTCVLGMVVKREREIRNFVKTPFYRVVAETEIGGRSCEGEWKAVENTRYFNSPLLYKENGFKTMATAKELVDFLTTPESGPLTVEKLEKKKETKNPPLLYNLAELQNDCAKFFKVSPDETLRIVQELYEKKLTTYPRTDARVLSTAVCKEISKNIRGLTNYSPCGEYAGEVLAQGKDKGLAKTRYVNDKQITDHYAIIPTGQGLGSLRQLPPTAAMVYEIIVRRFLSIFYPAAVYQKISLTLERKGEKFFAGFKVLAEEGYLKVANHAYGRKSGEKPKVMAESGAVDQTSQNHMPGEASGESADGTASSGEASGGSTDGTASSGEALGGSSNGTASGNVGQGGMGNGTINGYESRNGVINNGGSYGTANNNGGRIDNGTSKNNIDKNDGEKDGEEEVSCDLDFMKVLAGLKKGTELPLLKLEIKEGETTPPKRYNSGTMILTMENAGQFIEDEELRAQIKGSGIGTSATRAEILKKLVTIKYLALNKKTQIITPTLMGEMIYDIVDHSIRALLDPALTASWEKGLTMVAGGDITEAEYMQKLGDFIARRTNQVKQAENQEHIYRFYEEAAASYQKK